MQGYNIMVAKAKVLPSFLFTTQTPDPLSLTTGRGLYVGFGLEIPVWDGFKRIRNVSKQKAVLRQYGAEKDLKEFDLTDKWNALQEDLQISASARRRPSPGRTGPFEGAPGRNPLSIRDGTPAHLVGRP